MGAWPSTKISLILHDFSMCCFFFGYKDLSPSQLNGLLGPSPSAAGGFPSPASRAQGSTTPGPPHSPLERQWLRTSQSFEGTRRPTGIRQQNQAIPNQTKSHQPNTSKQLLNLLELYLLLLPLRCYFYILLWYSTIATLAVAPATA